MKERDFYKLIEGRDEEGRPNAMCSLVIVGPDDHNDPVDLGDATSFDGAVYPAIVPGGLSMIDVMFDDPVNFDYIKMSGLCEQFNKMLVSANTNGSEMPSLILTVSEQGELSAIMSCVNCAWTFVPTSPEKVCTGLRFIVDTNNIHFLEFNEEQLYKVLDELEDEIIADDQPDVDRRGVFNG